MTDRRYTFGAGVLIASNGDYRKSYAITGLELTMSKHQFAPAPLPETPRPGRGRATIRCRF